MNDRHFLVLFYIITLGKLSCKASCVDIGEKCVKGSKFGGTVVKSLSPVGITGCGKFCTRHGSCSGFNYHPSSLLCELADDATRKGTVDEGWFSCENIEFEKPVGSCASPQVAKGHYFVVLSNGKSKRVIDQCVKTPSIKDGRIIIINRSVGSQAGLSCNSGHQGVGKPSATCLEWSTSQFSCIALPVYRQPPIMA